jgi:FlaA1/EpsC-like NDP-sugar epimerase
MSIAISTFKNQLSENLILLNRWMKVTLMLVGDLVALPLCFLIAMLLRMGAFEPVVHYGIVPYMAIAVITIAVFSGTGLYRAVIRFIDQRLLAAAGIGLAMVVVAVCSLSFSFNELELPRSAVMIYWFIAFSYVVSSRLTVRTFLRHNSGKICQKKNRVAIYGAGEAGAQLASAMRFGNEYQAVCFLDDKASLSYQNVAGLTVFHSSRLNQLVHQLNIGLVVLAIPSATAERRRQIMRAVREAGTEMKTLQGLMELADEKISTHSIREIKIEDLLGREAVPPKVDLFAKCVQGKNVLVTGAGGSIGSELCRQIAALNPTQLHLLDHCEYALYTIRQELGASFPKIDIHPHLGSVCNAQLVERIMRQSRIDTVYHAAAYKHVPMVEANMAEGVRNNVLGAEVVTAAAESCHVGTCVLISSDKAVRPTNVMGASKRIAELIFQAAAAKPDSATTFCIVRFGNVLGSSGSVVPLFQRQIEQGGPITITHPDIVRYFMLIPEAAQLVIQAGAMAKGGDVFVLDMGEPVKIVDLARTMIDMSGLQEKNEQKPDGDIEIRYVGLRPGEKLYEELLIGDMAIPSSHPRIMCVKEYSFPRHKLAQLIENLIGACHTYDSMAIRNAIQSIVHEYVPPLHGQLAPEIFALSNFPAQLTENSVVRRGNFPSRNKESISQTV